MQREAYNKIAVVHLLDSAAINDTDTKTRILDCRDHSEATIVVNVGTATGADADSFINLILQESDTTADADFSAVAIADMKRAITTATAGLFGVVNSTSVDNADFKVGYIGAKRYIRVLLDFTTGTGGVTAGNVAVNGLLTGALRLPVVAVSPITAT